MNIVINVIVTFILIPWPMIIMTSPMMFDAPGSENDKHKVFFGFMFMCYPVFIFFLLGVFWGEYFGVNAFMLSLISMVVIFLLLSLFGYTAMVVNLMRGIPNSGYGVEKNAVYYNATLIPEADPGTFKPYKKENYHYAYGASQYASDKKSFYYRGKRLPSVSVENLKGKIIANELYWLNDTKVVKDGSVLLGRDPLTFGGYEGFSKWTYSKYGDEYKVYYNDVLVEEVDFSSFKPLNDSLSKDKNTIFYNGDSIGFNVDVDTFEPFSIYGFATDKNNFYYLGYYAKHKVEGADPESFENLGWDYYKDKSNIYYLDEHKGLRALENADHDSFEVLGRSQVNDYNARDNKSLYKDGEVFHFESKQ